LSSDEVIDLEKEPYMNFHIPNKVNLIIEELMKHGYEAYAVGGCVRDMVLGREPEDWDITTSATPYEVKRIFRRTVDTGIIHGTVTVLMDKEHYEVTTYRLDGEYEDNRHPKQVEFTSSLSEDLKRRDFTINAMAYNEKEGFIDLFGGMEDLQKGLIRCVGSAKERFDEDALRILRAVRFSAQLGFVVEEDTLKAIRAKAENLKNISAERIRVELTKLLLSDHPDRLRLLYELGITKVVLPEFDAMMMTGQKNIHHIYSVGEHTMAAVSEVAGALKDERYATRERTILRWTMLLHDVEKPNTITLGKDGQNHFYGHQEKGAMTAKNILRRLKFDNDTIDAVVHLIRWHDYRFVLTPAGMRKAASKIGKEYMELLFEVNRADTSAKNPQHTKEKFERLAAARQLYHEIIQNGECVSLKELKINGRDLIAIGMKPGKEMGAILDRMLSKVLENPDLNDRNTLLTMAQELLAQQKEDK
jgi:tRNA nucleotidyltransferase (CCA-adding enzyme)